ncbi:hypothetical protein Tco_1534823 [Tanacetum coccineum]
MIGSRRSHDMTKYFHLHEDHGHDTNQFREFRHQSEEAVKSGQLAHLVEAPILIINRENHTSKRKSAEEPVNGIREITFTPVSGANNSSDPVIIKAQISRRQIAQSGLKDPTHWVLGGTLLAPSRIPLGNHNRR